MREGSGKKKAVTSVLNLLVTSATAACMPALQHKLALITPQGGFHRMAATSIKIHSRFCQSHYIGLHRIVKCNAVHKTFTASAQVKTEKPCQCWQPELHMSTTCSYYSPLKIIIKWSKRLSPAFHNVDTTSGIYNLTETERLHLIRSLVEAHRIVPWWR